MAPRKARELDEDARKRVEDSVSQGIQELVSRIARLHRVEESVVRNIMHDQHFL